MYCTKVIHQYKTNVNVYHTFITWPSPSDFNVFIFKKLSINKYSIITAVCDAPDYGKPSTSCDCRVLILQHSLWVLLRIWIPVSLPLINRIPPISYDPVHLKWEVHSFQRHQFFHARWWRKPLFVQCEESKIHTQIAHHTASHSEAPSGVGRYPT